MSGLRAVRIKLHRLDFIYRKASGRQIMEITQILGLAAILFLISAAWVWLEHARVRRILEHMERMLEHAADGSFQESRYDESLLSSLEAKLADYLSASAVSARNLSGEKEKVKQLISDISHQTKTPVANLLLYAQMLEERELPKEEREFVQEINRQAQKLNFLIVSLVKASRLETGAFVLHPKWNLLSPMLEEAVRQAAHAAQEKQISIAYEPAEARAYFDRKWTAEAVANIVDNAVKYTPKGGSVTVRMMDTGMFARIEIQDTGIGMTESETAEIFKRFYRSPAVSGQEGTGIGLYLAREMIASENGYIKVRSKPGRGTSFFVYLPSGCAYNMKDGQEACVLMQETAGWNE